MSDRFRDERGAVFVEYLVVLTIATVAIAAAIGALGVPLYRTFEEHVTWLSLPVP